MVDICRAAKSHCMKRKKCQVTRRKETVLFFFQEGTVTNPAIWLVLSAVRIFLSLTTVTVTAGNSAGEIVMFSYFS